MLREFVQSDGARRAHAVRARRRRSRADVGHAHRHDDAVQRPAPAIAAQQREKRLPCAASACASESCVVAARGVEKHGLVGEPPVAVACAAEYRATRPCRSARTTESRDRSFAEACSCPSRAARSRHTTAARTGCCRCGVSCAACGLLRESAAAVAHAPRCRAPRRRAAVPGPRGRRKAVPSCAALSIAGPARRSPMRAPRRESMRPAPPRSRAVRARQCPRRAAEPDQCRDQQQAERVRESPDLTPGFQRVHGFSSPG